MTGRASSDLTRPAAITGAQQGWLRIMRIDAWFSMAIYTLATIAFYLLGAAVLNAKGLEVSNDEMVRVASDESRARAVKWTCISLPVVYLVIFASFGSPVSLVAVGAVAQALMLPLLALAGLYFLYFETVRSLKPGRTWTMLLWLSAPSLP